MAEPECYHYDLKQPTQHRDDTGQANRTTKWDLCLRDQSNAPLRRPAAPLSPRHDMESHCWSTHGTEDEDGTGSFSPSELKPSQNDDIQFQRLEAKKHALAMFKDWKGKTEDIAPLEKRFTPSLGQLMADILRKDEFDTSDDELVVVSHPGRRPKTSFHFACPFYIYDPENCHQCLLTSNLRSISDVIEHLFEFHDRPCYCVLCYKTFDTQIDRDNHHLNEKCEKRTPGPLFGLTESQKAMLLGIDTHHFGEKARWLDIWSIVFPHSRKPRMPYLDDGAGLGVPMMRDFWGLYGSRCILESLTLQGIPRCEQRGLAGNLYELVLQDLLNSA